MNANEVNIQRLFSVLILLMACGLFSGKASAASDGTVCGTSAGVVPMGHVITRIDRVNTCPNSSDSKYTYKDPSSSGSKTTICNNSSIPNGFMIVGKRTDDQYPYCEQAFNNYLNATIIQYPASSLSSMDICTDITGGIPPGWIITRKNLTQLNGCSGSRWRLEKAVNANYTMCSGSTLPPGYVVYEQGSYSQCEAGSSSGAGSKITSSFGDQITICGNPGVPSGYVVIERRDSWGSCSGNAITIKSFSSISSGIAVCDGPWGEPIPTGMVITARGSYPQCVAFGYSGAGYYVDVPSTGSSTTVCSPSPLPTGYAITDKDSYAQCADSGTGPGWKIFPVTAGVRACHDAAFTLPSGWGFTASGQYFECAAGAGVAGPGAIISPISAGSYVCANSPVPGGWVITQITNQFQQCDFAGGDSYQVSPPDPNSSMDICFNSTSAPIPTGYVKTKVSSSSICDVSIAHSAITIELPSTTSETFICENSPIPENYAVTQFVSSVSNCGSLVTSGYMISLLTGNGPYYICDDAPIPAGYVVTARDSNFDFCGTGGGFTVYRADAFPDGIVICAGTDSPIPAGYVITQVTTSGGCQTTFWPDTAYNIEYPAPLGSTTICNVSGVPVPAGYVVDGNASPTAPCGSFSASTIYPENQLPVVPSPYIGIEPDVTNLDITPIDYDCTTSAGNSPGFPKAATPKNTTLCP